MSHTDAIADLAFEIRATYLGARFGIVDCPEWMLHLHLLTADEKRRFSDYRSRTDGPIDDGPWTETERMDLCGLRAILMTGRRTQESHMVEGQGA